MDLLSFIEILEYAAYGGYFASLSLFSILQFYRGTIRILFLIDCQIFQKAFQILYINLIQVFQREILQSLSLKVFFIFNQKMKKNL